MKRLFIHPIIYCTLLLTSCDDGSGGGSNPLQPRNLVKASVVGATDIFTLLENDGADYSCWTVDQNGNWAPLTFTNDKGEIVPYDEERLEIHNVNDKYLLIEKMPWYVTSHSPWPMMLVEKTTGVIHHIPASEELDGIDTDHSNRLFYTDKNGNIYSIIRSQGIKINTTDFTLSQYVPAVVQRLFVDQDGICCYSDQIHPINMYGEEIYEGNCGIRHPAGKSYTLDELLPQAQGKKYMVLGPDNKAFIVTLFENADQTTLCTIYKVNSDQSTLNAEQVLSQTLTSKYYGKFYYNNIRNTLIFFSLTTTNTQVVEFDGTTLKATAAGTDFRSGSYLAKDALYFHDNGSMPKGIKVDLRFLQVDWFTVVTSQFDKFAFDVNKLSTGLPFQGVRIFDNKYVYGHVDQTGTCMVDGESVNGSSFVNRVKLN